MTTLDPTKRQVLVNLGNRFVVFGQDVGLPEPVRFDPEDSPILPRVSDESEAARTRIPETLQIFGMKRSNPDSSRTLEADAEFIDSNGRRILIETKVRESDPKQRDLLTEMERLRLAAENDANLEVWFFNIERLGLTVLRREGSEFRFDHLVPLNVWEKTADSTFERQRVVDEVDDWVNRIIHLYTDIQDWLSGEVTLCCEQTRSVVMSDEMMQKFAVSDRELPVLDVLRDNEVLASFVPRGLWLIGAWGRIDVITRERTLILVALRREGRLEWWLTSPGDRKQMRMFDKSTILEVVTAQ